MTGRWIDVLRPASGRPRGRVVVVPHAGSGPGGLQPLAVLLPVDLEVVGVTLPGRERRFREPFAATAADPDALVARVVAALRELRPVVPTTLFGHSLGAALAAAVAASAPGDVERLVLSAYPVTGTPAERAGRWGEQRLLEILRDGGGTPSELLRGPRWRAHLLEVLRNDLTLAVRLVHTGPGPLSVPLTVIDGDADLLVPDTDPHRWCEVARAGLRHALLPGGHFYLLDDVNRGVVADLIAGRRVPDAVTDCAGPLLVCRSP